MTHDELSIRRIIDAWPVWRDSGHWQQLRECWHETGWMVTTGGVATADQFVAAAAAGWDRGLDVQHLCGGSAIEIDGSRAVAHTKATISQRAEVDGTVCDAQCLGRFVDFLDKRDERWAIVLRQPVYERSRLDPVDAGITLALDETVLAGYPASYRHLAYLQEKNGMTVRRDLPERKGAAIAHVQELARRWLSGEPMDLGREIERRP